MAIIAMVLLSATISAPLAIIGGGIALGASERRSNRRICASFDSMIAEAERNSGLLQRDH